MADFTLSFKRKFPEGTTVEAYPESNWTGGNVDTSAAPVGSADDSQTVSSGSVTFTGLTAGQSYVAYALVGGEHRYMKFMAGEDVAEGSSQANTAEDETISGSWTFNEPLPVGAPTASGHATRKGELDTHAADTSNVHGVTDTSDLSTDTVRGASGKGYVEHGATAGTARPTGYASVEWVGSVEPSNAVDGDTWVDVS